MQGLKVEILGEFDDAALMKAFGAAQRVTGGSKACFEALSAGDCAAIVADSTALAYYTH